MGAYVRVSIFQITKAVHTFARQPFCTHRQSAAYALIYKQFAWQSQKQKKKKKKLQKARYTQREHKQIRALQIHAQQVLIRVTAVAFALFPSHLASVYFLAFRHITSFFCSCCCFPLILIADLLFFFCLVFVFLSTSVTTLNVFCGSFRFIDTHAGAH